MPLGLKGEHIERGIVTGNVYDKYGTRNPLARLLVGGFLRELARLFDPSPEETVLEVGSGDGQLLAQLLVRRPARAVYATDVSLRLLACARPRVKAVFAQSAEALALGDRSVDVVLACEVLEHLPNPERALQEIARVARRRVILSVPNEPLWRILNLARGRYLLAGGNTPGHLQHFSRQAFCDLIARHLRIVEVRSPLPWTLIAASPR